MLLKPPLFTPDQVTTASLGLLTAAAAPEKAGTGPGAPIRALLSKPGPHNPTASLAQKVVKRILNLEFVEMPEVTLDDVVPPCFRPPATSPASNNQYLSVDRKVLTHGGCPMLLVPRQGRGTLLPTRHRLFARSGNTRTNSGLPMTASIGMRHSHIKRSVTDPPAL